MNLYKMDKDIAIIGVSGRFPMAEDLNELYINLKEGRDCVTDISDERIKQTTLPENRKYRRCGFLKDVDKFDYGFFGVTLAEAKTMSPDQRMLLEIIYATMENSGYKPDSFSGSNTGVFVSTAQSNYYKHASEYVSTLYTGNSPEFLAAKIGRHFNLKGNVSVIDTTCSSSLVALHAACSELIIGDADLAFVAGVNLVLFPFYGDSGLDTESPDGKSRAFSADANGMSYGEVAAAVLLKPLKKALEDKDHIHSVIKGTAVNYNGNRSLSITAPDSKSQAHVLLKAWKKAGIKATDLSYIEAHGSGTQLGDSLEFEALNLAFKEFTSERHICPISTIKSNMGHGRNVSGLSGLIKTILSLKHKVLFPTIHFDKPNPLLDFENSSIYVNKEFSPWQVKEGKARYAGVTSLGASGTNCHVVLQEAPETFLAGANNSFSDRLFLVPVSAKSEMALQGNVEALYKYIQSNEALRIEDISYTLIEGRNQYDYRKSFMVSDLEQLKEKLAQDLSARTPAIHLDSAKLIVILADSLLLTDEIIQSFRANYKVFNTLWESCSAIKELTNKTLKDFAFQYSLYKLFDIPEATILSIGIGNIIHQVLVNELTLLEGLTAAGSYVGGEIEQKEERIARLLKNVGTAENTTFLDLSLKGGLSDGLDKFNAVDQCIYYSGNRGCYPGVDSMLDMLNALYLRNVNPVANYLQIAGITGRRIELPSYQFERNPCWIRDEAYVEAHEHAVSQPLVLKLKEDASNMEWKIADIFSGILEIYELSIHDDFFELGGDSLKGTKVILKIKTQFGISLDFEDIFDFPQISSLAEFVDTKLNTEMKVTLIWEEILQAKALKADDNFFDLGGHSLLATQIIILLNKEFDINLNFEDIFRHTTIKALAVHIDSSKLLNDGSVLKNKIVAVPDQHFYSLTHAQKRMFFLDQFVEDSSAYNNILGIRLEGNLDYTVFDKAIQAIVESQEALRTVFKMVDGEAKQFVLDSSDVVFKSGFFEISESGNQEEQLNSVILEESRHIFDVSMFPLFRCNILKTEDKKHICILNIHHIISDGSSIGLFMESFYKFYELISLNKTEKITPFPIQIKDYAEWQNSSDFKQILNQQEAYWLNRYKIPAPVLSLPADRRRPVIQSFEGETLSFHLSPQTSVLLKQVARNNGATLYMILLAIYNILLSKLTGVEDIVVGTTVAGRRFKEIQSLIGLFANTLVIRNYPHSKMKFGAFLTEVKNITLEAFDNQEYPYEDLVHKLLTERDSGRNPLFDTMFILQNIQSVRGQFSNIVTSPFSIENRTAQFDLLLEARESEMGIEFNFNYSTALFNKDTIRLFVEYFKNITSAIIRDQDISISAIEIITKNQKELILQEFNNTKAEFPGLKTIHGVFEEVAFAKGISVALVFEGNTFSYKELNEGSNRLARYIIDRGIQQGSFIGIMINRSFEMILSIFAVLKAGCAYVPIDPEYPLDRIAYIIEDSGLSILLTETESLKSPVYQNISVDVSGFLLSEASSNEMINPGILPDPNSLAYLIYTSGSTGRPKGVMIEHQNILNFVSGISAIIDFNKGNTVLSLTTISFDIFVLEVILPLLKGLKVVIGSSNDQKDPVALTQLVKEQQVDMIQMTPSHLKLFIAGNSSFLDGVKVLMIGGEPFSDELFKKLKTSFSGAIFNMYGPTETTVWSTVQNLTNAASIDIGKPIANTSIYILNNNNQLQPIGIAGELCIGGSGVARGYWNNQQLTSEKFIQDPVTGTGKIYRTGDLAKWLPDGSIECLGRMDNQVKIRGFRIELGEIENQLRLLKGISEAVVTVRETEGDKVLSAYYVADQELSIPDIRNYLSGVLPSYMIPSYYQKLDKIPLTPNGKIDARQLPDPQIVTSDTYQPPHNDEQEKLVIIWEEILNTAKNKIGIDDGFFEIGGHSFGAIRLIYRIQEVFSVKVSMREIFEYATVRKISQLITGKYGQQAVRITRTEEKSHYPVSPAQERLYNQQFLNKDTLAYNISDMFHIKGVIEVEKITMSFQRLIDRHESLRTNFEIISEGLVQIIHQNVDFNLIQLNAADYPSPADAFHDFIKPFDLASFPLMRCALLKSDQSGCFLMVDIHHIICDGMSLNILMNEFRSLYQGLELQETGLRYIDYVMWQKMSQEGLMTQKKYWAEKLSGEIPELNLPVNEVWGSENIEHAFLNEVVIEGDLYQSIKQFIALSGTTDFMFFISAYYILLSKISGNDDLIIGTDVVGRTDAALMNIVGTFTNLLPLRVHVDPELSYSDFLSSVKECVVEAFDNQDYQYDQIVSQFNEQNMDPKKLINTHFSFPNYLYEDAGLKEAVFDRYAMGKELITSFELKLEVQDRNEKFHIGFIFSKLLFDHDTADLFVQYYLNILSMLLKDNSILIDRINVDELIS